MRKKAKILVLSFTSSSIVFATFLVIGQIHFNVSQTKSMTTFLEQWQNGLTQDRYIELSERATQKFELYDEIIKQNFLLDGMVINRDRDGKPVDICDSLLFSSIRFVALSKMGKTEEASKAWKAISKSQYRGHWHRHPRCKKSTSRDMIIGVLAALSRKPLGSKNHLIQLSDHIKKRRGFISYGPPYVSYLSPGLGNVLHRMLEEEGIAFNLPFAISRSFSTLELDSAASDDGYRTHLNALMLWLEMEIDPPASGTFIHFANKMGRFANKREVKHVRQQWISQTLFSKNPKNLFYKWLMLRSTGALNDATKTELLNELLLSEYFPSKRNPNSCDRKADYLWQRSFDEYLLKDSSCRYEYNGVDFLWITSLLLDSERSLSLAH